MKDNLEVIERTQDIDFYLTIAVATSARDITVDDFA